ncbi:adenine-specific DNA-methyltransferase, partial [Caloramator proteoclasticus DSM 10124]
AGEKIKKETGREDLDIGFKVFKLDYSNIKIWNPNYDDIKSTLLDIKNNIVEGRTKEDVLYEIILKLGLDLTTKIEEINIDNKKLYRVADGALIVCLEDEITIELVKQIPSLVSEFMKDDVRIVFLETAFSGKDSLKLNTVQTLKQLGIKEENIRSV